MTVILAYQIAELHQNKHVKDFSTQEKWISDKYAPIDDEGSVLSAPYTAYLKSIREDANRIEEKAVLSVHYWISKDVTPETYVPALFPVDCKSIGAAGMYAHMKDKNDAWDFLGNLTVNDRSFSREEKTEEKQRKSSTFFNSLENLALISLKSDTFISPSSSPSPIAKRDSFVSPNPTPSPLAKSSPAYDAEEVLALCVF